MIALYLLLFFNADSENTPDKGMFFQIPGPRKVQGNISKTTDGFTILIQMKPTTCLDETRNLNINILNLKAYAFAVFNKHGNNNSKFKITESSFKIKSSNNLFVTGELRLKTVKETQSQKTTVNPKNTENTNVLNITIFNSGKIWNETLDFYAVEAKKDIESIKEKLEQINGEQFDILVTDTEKMWNISFQQTQEEINADKYLLENDLPEDHSKPNLILKAKKSEESFTLELKKLVESRIKFELEVGKKSKR